METANLVTYPELFQLLAIFSGVWLALLSLVGSVAVTWYIRDSNRRDHDNDRRFRDVDRRFGEVDRRFDEVDRRFDEVDRRFAQMEETMDRRFSEAAEAMDLRFQHAEETNERRHQEVLRAIGLLYHHVHADGSPAIIPLPDADPSVPAPADN